MKLCDYSITLNIFMYFKYIILFLFVLLFIISILNKNDRDSIIKRIKKILMIIIIIYLLIFLIVNFTNINLKKCFINSNPKDINIATKLTNAYKSDFVMESTDGYIDKVNPQTTNKIIGGKEIYIYNQNEYPLSSFGFTFSDSLEDNFLKKSGNEIVTLSSLISSITNDKLITPIEIIKVLKYKDIDLANNYNIDYLIQILSNEYNYKYKLITANELAGGIKNGGIVLAKVNGNENSTIFTCTEGYILLYNYDSSSKFSIMSSNDKDYDYICPENTEGFGNIIKSNINKTTFSYGDIVNSSENYYLIWR